MPAHSHESTATGDIAALPSARGARLDVLVGAFVLAAYLSVRLWLLLGPRVLDSGKYFDTAVRFPHVPADLWTLRIGVIAPVRLAVLVFGPSEASLYGVPIVAGLVIAGAVYAAMLILFGDRLAAAAAAAVAVMNPDFLFYSSYIYPDIVATATFTAGFLLVLLGAARTERGPKWLPSAAAVGAGVLFGWTFLAREFSPILLPAVLAAVVLLRYSGRRIALLAGAAVATGALELVYGLVRYHDPFIHARLLLGRNHTHVGGAGGRMAHIQSQLGNIFDTTVVFPRLLLSWWSGWFFLLVIAIFLVALVLVRDRRLWILGAWVLSFWAIMSVVGLGELPSGRWILNVTNVRYWYPILPGLAMGAFGGVWLLLRARAPAGARLWLARTVPLGLAILVVTPGLVEFDNCVGRKAQLNDPMQRWHELRSWFATREADAYGTVWTDRQTVRIVPAYTSSTLGRRLWDGHVEAFPDASARIPASADLSRALLLVQKDRFRIVVRRAETRLDEVRREWRPVFVSSDGDMVLLAHRPPSSGQAAWWRLSGPVPRVEPGTCGRNPYGA